MSGDINKAVLVGRLTRDAELSYTNTAFAYTKFSIAVNRRKKSGEQWVDEANFFDVVIWGKRGEALANYLKKGTQIAIEGELRQERWEKDGVKRSKVTIEATNIQLIGGKAQDAVRNGQETQQRNEALENSGSNNNGSFEDDIPF